MSPEADAVGGASPPLVPTAGLGASPPSAPTVAPPVSAAAESVETAALRPERLRAWANEWEREQRELESHLDGVMGRATPATTAGFKGAAANPRSPATQARHERAGEGAVAEVAVAEAAAAEVEVVEAAAEQRRAAPPQPTPVATAAPVGPGSMTSPLGSPLLEARARVASILAEVGLSDATEDVWAEASAAVRDLRGRPGS